MDKEAKFSKSPVHQREVPCAAIFYSFAIDCKGNFFPCNSFLYKVGNIYEESIKNIWYYSERLKEIWNIRNSDLKMCAICNKKDFCERCPGLAYAESGFFLSCDSYAEEVAEIRENKYRII